MSEIPRDLIARAEAPPDSPYTAESFVIGNAWCVCADLLVAAGHFEPTGRPGLVVLEGDSAHMISLPISAAHGPAFDCEPLITPITKAFGPRWKATGQLDCYTWLINADEGLKVGVRAYPLQTDSDGRLVTFRFDPRREVVRASPHLAGKLSGSGRCEPRACTAQPPRTGTGVEK